MSSKRGRSRSSGAVSDTRSNDSKGSPESSESESQKPIEGIQFEYETEDGLKISLDPTSAELSREYEITENDFIELSVGIDWSPADMKIEKKGLDLDVSGSIELPGDALGFSAGIVIDLGSGEVSGGEVGVELAGAEVEVSVEGEKGCKKSISVSYMGIGIGYVRDDCNEDEDTDSNESEEDIKQPSANSKRLTPKQLRGMLPRSSCAGVIFTICYHRIDTWDDSTNKWINGDRQGGLGEGTSGLNLPIRFMDFRGVALNSGFGFNERCTVLVSEGGGLSYEAIGKPIRRITTTTEGYFSIAGDGSVSRSYGAGSIGYDIDDPNIFDAIFGASSIYYVYPPDPNSECNIKDVRSSRNRPRIPPSPPPKRDMNDCCRESTKLMREIHQALGVRRLLNDKFSVPNKLVITGGTGVHKNDDYLDIVSDLFKSIDSHGFNGPVTAFIKDVNKAKKGDQSVELQFQDLASMLKTIVELNIELKGDAANRLNLQIRQANMITRMYRTITKLWYRVTAILDFLNPNLKKDSVTLPFEFNLLAGKSFKGQGFGNGSGEPKLDLKDEDVTESLLENFLDTVDVDIDIDELAPRSPTIQDLINRRHG